MRMERAADGPGLVGRRRLRFGRKPANIRATALEGRTRRGPARAAAQGGEPVMADELKTRIQTPAAPKASGPYSQAIVANGMVFCSGQVAVDPVTNQLIEGDIRAQTHRALKNLDAVLKAA